MVLVTGIITILCCLLGLYYNLTSLKNMTWGGIDDVEEIKNAPYVYPAYYSMSAVCFAFYLCLIAFSVDLISGSFRTVVPFTVVVALEVIYIVVAAQLCRHPKIGYSIGCAFGVANGGLMVQFYIALPLWAPLVLWFAK